MAVLTLPLLLFLMLRQLQALLPPLGAEKTGAVAGVVVLQHGGRVAPGVARAGQVSHGRPALPARSERLLR